MQIKCPRCNLSVQIISAIVLWIDVVISCCVSMVQLSETQAESCFKKSLDCRKYYMFSEFLLLNAFVGLVALIGVRKNKPVLLLPYAVCKILNIIVVLVVLLFWKYLSSSTNTSTTTKSSAWLPTYIDIPTGIFIFITFMYQIYATYVIIWSYKEILRTLSATRPTKSFKSVVSIWIGDTSRTNICHNDSTCIIETETR